MQRDRAVLHGLLLLVVRVGELLRRGSGRVCRRHRLMLHRLLLLLVRRLMLLILILLRRLLLLLLLLRLRLGVRLGKGARRGLGV